MDSRIVIIVFFAFVGIHSQRIPLGCNEVKTFVQVQNTYRLSVAKGKVKNQPPASDMNILMWDKDLEEKAAGWAAQNKEEHNPDRSDSLDRFQTGENLYFETTSKNFSKKLIKDCIQGWFNENIDFEYRPLVKADFDGSKQVGHYGQLVSANASYVGCAVHKFPGTSSTSKYAFVCNYGPGGNIIGVEPYTKSKKPQNKLICSLDKKPKVCKSKLYADYCK